MAQSLNTKVYLHTSAVSYLGLNKVGKIMIGDKAIEFYNDRNVEDYIQIPWENIQAIGASVRGKKISRHFEIYTDQGKFLFASKDSGKLLKVARQELGNDKVIQLPTLLQKISSTFSKPFKKK